MPIPLVVTKRYEGQRVTSWWQPATQTNRDPNRDKKLCGSTSNGTDQYQNGSSNLLTPYREQPRSTRNVVAYPRPTFSAKNRKNYGKITLQPVLINKSKILKATHCTEIRKNEIPRSMLVVEALSWRSRRASQHPAVQSPVHPWKRPTNLARSPLLVALVGRKNDDRGQTSAFPSETSRFKPVILAHRGSALPWLVDDRAALRLHRIWCGSEYRHAAEISKMVLYPSGAYRCLTQQQISCEATPCNPPPARRWQDDRHISIRENFLRAWSSCKYVLCTSWKLYACFHQTQRTTWWMYVIW